jgi:type I restriction enzyme S subunit
MLLLNHFHQLTIDPENAKEIKGLILQLAIQGKLTSEWRKKSTTNDSANNLLKQVELEKRLLIKSGKLKSERQLPVVEEESEPFSLPAGWTWTRLGTICIKIGSGSTPRGGKDVYKSEGIKFIRSQNVYNEGLVFKNVAYIDNATHARMQGTKVLADDILLNITGGSIGRCALVPNPFDEANVSQHVTIVRLASVLENEFVHLLMMSPFFQDYIMLTQTGGNREGLAKKNMELMLVPLAPLPEQRAIIEIVKQLFTEVDQLEAFAKERVELKRRLAIAALGQVVKETKAGKLFVDEHFHILFDEVENIKKLQETILQLAVQGKLTKQDPTDRPATELLKRIKSEKEKFIKAGKLKKEKELPPITEDEIPFELPEGWLWSRLSEVSKQITDGEHITPPRISSGYKLLSAKNVREGFIDYENCDYVSQEIYEKCIKRCKPEIGDLLIISVGGTIGRTSLIKEDIPFVIVRSVAMIKPLIIESEYLKIVMNSPLLQRIIANKSRGGAQPCLYLNEIVKFVFPLPPLAEQQRIVAKVQQLHQQLSQLEAQVQQSRQYAQQLLQSVLREALQQKGEIYEMKEEMLSMVAEGD